MAVLAARPSGMTILQPGGPKAEAGGMVVVPDARRWTRRDASLLALVAALLLALAGELALHQVALQRQALLDELARTAQADRLALDQLLLGATGIPPAAALDAIAGRDSGLAG